MPNPAHELAIRLFDLLISLELHVMNVLCDMRSFGLTTITVENWKKEADCCWAPASTNTRLSMADDTYTTNKIRFVTKISSRHTANTKSTYKYASVVYSLDEAYIAYGSSSLYFATK